MDSNHTNRFAKMQKTLEHSRSPLNTIFAQSNLHIFPLVYVPHSLSLCGAVGFGCLATKIKAQELEAL